MDPNQSNMTEQREKFLETSQRAEKEVEPFEPQGRNPACQWLLYAIYRGSTVPKNAKMFDTWFQDGVQQELGMHSFCRTKNFVEIADALISEETVNVFPDEHRSELRRNGKSEGFKAYHLPETDYAIFCEHFAGARFEMRQASNPVDAWSEARTAVVYQTAKRFDIGEKKFFSSWKRDHDGFLESKDPLFTFSDVDGFKSVIGGGSK